MKQKLKISILPFSVLLMVLIIMVGADTSYAINFGKPYPVFGTSLFGRDFPMTNKFEMSVAVIHEYTPGCNWSWHSIGSALEMRYFYKLVFNSWGINSCVTTMLAYPVHLKHEYYPEYKDSTTLEFAANVYPLACTFRCLLPNLDLTLYGPGIRLSKVFFYDGVAGEKYDWKRDWIIGASIKFRLCFL